MRTNLKARIKILLVFLSLSPCIISAQMVPELYQAKVIITDRSSEELARGFSEALVKVLIKLTGQSEVSSSMPWVKMLVDGAESFIERYSFEPNLENNTELNLLAVFDKKILSQELKTLEIRQWNSIRPQTLFKFNPRNEDLFSTEGQRQYYYDYIISKANDRGLPVRVYQSPSGSIDNLSAEKGYQNYRDDFPAIVEFSISNYSERDVEIYGLLSFFNEKKIINLSTSDVKMGLEKLVDSVADYVAEKIISNLDEVDEQKVILEIFGINSSEKFKRLLDYLDALEQIGDIFIRAIEANLIKLEIAIVGGLKGFEQSVMYSELLQKTSNDNLSRYTLLEQQKNKNAIEKN